jgi:hypothetical protein
VLLVDIAHELFAHEPAVLLVDSGEIALLPVRRFPHLAEYIGPVVDHRLG